MVQKLLLIAFILGICIWAVIPPKERIRLGKDLRGGTSLIYSVDVAEDDPNPSETINQTIAVLKDRVNPNGVLDISIEPIGPERIEIVMPLPGEEVKAMQEAYRDAQEKLLDMAEIPEDELVSAAQAGEAVDRFGGEPGSMRYTRIEALQEATTELSEARDALANAADLPREERGPLVTRVANAEIEYEDALRRAMDVSLEESRIKRTLALSNQREPVEDADGDPLLDAQGDPVMTDSLRDLALAEIETEFPHLQQQLAATVEAYDTYQSNRKGFDDPEDLIRLLRGAGVLEFHIAVTPTEQEGVNVADLTQQLNERGPQVDSPIAGWYPINDLTQWADDEDQLAALRADPAGFLGLRGYIVGMHEGVPYMLLYRSSSKSMMHGPEHPEWQLTGTSNAIDQLGRPAVGFQLDPSGGTLMARMTANHLQQPMAIVLDDQVYSAPNINGQIASNGIIQGRFSQSEIEYLIRVLAAGSLEARLSENPIAMNTLGPSIGADNLERGLESFIIAIIAVAIFMLIYYFFAGLVADFALLCNGLIIFGMMALIDGTFTLPGLAGIVLTIGMAVDANVLIYERIREELVNNKLDLRAAIREGYAKAFSTIMDANVTNLFVCGALAMTATTEVKGFAVTLAIGICATMFTALFVTRQFFTLYTEFFKMKKLNMLPIAVPAIHRALEPAINWIGLRKIFWAVSAVAIVGSIVLVSSRGINMLDTEFRGGVSITMQTRTDGEGRLQIAQDDAQDRLADRITNALASTSDPQQQAILEEMSRANIVTVGETGVDAQGRLTGDQFQIKIATPKDFPDDVDLTPAVTRIIEEEFGAELDKQQAIEYLGRGDNDRYTEFTVPISRDNLAAVVELPDTPPHNIEKFRDGVAIVLRDVQPMLSVEEVRDRIDNTRNKPDFADTIGRRTRVFAIGDSAYAVLVHDPDINYGGDQEAADTRLAAREWALMNAALGTGSSFKQTSSFSSSVAQTLAASAVVAIALTLLLILIYIWFRFGSLRYSFAAITALAHDVTIALGLLALTAYIGPTAFGSMLLIDEFRIDLGVVAALLTIVGYSLNDTIVILDRIRENRGKLPVPTAPIVNLSINQTVSRTLLTSTTTIFAVLIMYIEGGTGIRSFTFCLLIGLLVGTYSSVAIASPLVFRGGEAEAAITREDLDTKAQPTVA